jgi:hypothetical protein
MAVVQSPLFSTSASGAYAKTITYAKYLRGFVAKKYSFPSGMASELQAQVRTWTKEIMQTWPTLSLEQQATWNALAEAGDYSPINAFQKYNFERLANGKSISPVFPAVESILIYTDGTNPLLEEQVIALFESGGSLSWIEDKIYSTPDLAAFNYNWLEGYSHFVSSFIFDGFNYLEGVQLDDAIITGTVTLKNCPILQIFQASNSGLTEENLIIENCPNLETIIYS